MNLNENERLHSSVEMKLDSGLFRTIVEKICIIITIILVYENALVFYQFLFPYWWSHGYYQRFFFHLIVGHWLLINTVVHYYRAITTLPGFVADLKLDSNENKSVNYITCTKCEVLKPSRAHHCKVCRKCVLRYDHHCPWINNCVGYRNHVHFLLFCVYMTMISGYATFTGETQFQLVAFHDKKLFSLFDSILKTENMTMALVEHKTIGPLTGVLVMFLYLINLIAMGLIFSLTVWQCALISKGQTCVEEKIDKSVRTNTNQTTLTNQRRPYDLGWKQNWKNFFETDTRFDLVKLLLFPTQFQPQHDGTRWVSKHQD